jgi:hypothetical protein
VHVNPQVLSKTESLENVNGHVPSSSFFDNFLDAISSRLKQGSLDGIVTCHQRAPTFTKDGLIDYIIELIVCEDEVCS